MDKIVERYYKQEEQQQLSRQATLKKQRTLIKKMDSNYDLQRKLSKKFTDVMKKN